MPVYKNILVTIDCSPVDDAVLEHIAALAQQNDAEVCLLHVVHSHTLGQERALRHAAETALNAGRERLEGNGVRVHTRIRSGEPEAEILAEIAGNEYDLLAMATHGHTFWADMLLGSVSDSLKHRIHIPMLLIRGDPPQRTPGHDAAGA
ncbi:MAG: universal stress protein [Kiritimatiellaeota bacterium]|nr:universal stress protein [Kiritimatiellota bacterium]